VREFTSERTETGRFLPPACRLHDSRAGGLLKRMLTYTWIFLILALIAAVFGFGGIAAAAAGIAKVLFFIFIVLFLIGLITGRRAV